MNDTLKKQLLDEAIRIGDEIIEKSVSDHQGTYWKTMEVSPDKQVDWVESEPVYNGVAGIILFLIELHKNTNDEKYKHVYIEAAQWLEHYCHENPTSNFAFFTGRMGVVYTFLQIAEALDDDRYKKVAIDLAKDCESFLSIERQIDDMINGICGTLMGLLHLHAATNDESLLKPIQAFTDRLLSRSNIGVSGLYWDRSNKAMTGLCGFSHGAAGIGYVFTELAHYFNNKSFFWVAEQAFNYENQFFNKEAGNWPDFRNGIFDQDTLEEHKTAYSENNIEFFTKPRYMSAWCHGAPGIGFARLQAARFYDKERYMSDVKMASKDVMASIALGRPDIPMSYTLCHGAGGNTMLLLDIYKSWPDKELLEKAYQVGAMGLESHQNGQPYISGFSMVGNIEDLSLFMGNAGIGYFYLNLLQPLNTPSILKPELKNTSLVSVDGISDKTLSDLQSQIISLAFPRTLAIYKEMTKEKSSFSIEGGNLKESFKKKVSEYLNDHPSERLEDALNYESVKNSLDDSVISHSYAYIKNHMCSLANDDISREKDQMLNTRLKLNDSCQTIESKWDWVTHQDGLNSFSEDEDTHYSIFLTSSMGIEEHSLNDFAYVVMESFKGTKTVQEAIDEVIKAFDVSSKEEKELISEHMLTQIDESLKICALISA